MILKNIPLFTRYSILLFSRTHGYAFALVFLIFTSITFLKPPKSQEFNFFLIALNDAVTTLVFMTCGINLLGSERVFWIVRVLCTSSLMTVFYERLIPFILYKLAVSPIYTYLYIISTHTTISHIDYISLFLLNFSVSFWFFVFLSIINPMPFSQYLFRTELQTTSAVNFLWVIVGILLIFGVTGVQLSLYYKLENLRDVWNMISIIFSVIFFISFWTFGIKLFERLMYKKRFIIMQKLRQTA